MAMFANGMRPSGTDFEDLITSMYEAAYSTQAHLGMQFTASGGTDHVAYVIRPGWAANTTLWAAAWGSVPFRVNVRDSAGTIVWGEMVGANTPRISSLRTVPNLPASDLLKVEVVGPAGATVYFESLMIDMHF